MNSVYWSIKTIVKKNNPQEKNQQKGIQLNISKTVNLVIQIQIIFIEILNLIN